MKLNKLYIFLAVTMVSMSLTACFDDQGDDVLLTGNYVEFEDSRLPNGRTASFIRIGADQTDMLDLKVNRVSTNSTAPITVDIAVDPASTAIAGVHYSLTATSVTIPAGSFVASLPVTVLTGNIDPSETPDLILNMTNASGATVSTNYGDLKLAIRVICPSELVGTYKVFWEYLQTGDGEGGPDQTTTDFVIAAADEVIFSGAGAGAYLVNDISFGMYPGLYSEAAPAGKIYDACGEITGDPSNADRFGDPFTINGMMNDDGTISITWSNTWGDGGTVVLTEK